MSNHTNYQPPTASHQSPITIQPPFDQVATDYDRQFTDTAVGQLLRARVYQLAGHPNAPGASVLELNCGTGADAVWLARRGSRVLATDISPEMVKIAQAKLITAGLNATAEAVLGDMTQLERMAVPNPGFDLIWSNFGGLNCLSPNDLRKLNNDLCRIISPQGTLIAIVMGRFCLWETVYFLLRGKPRQAFRRLKKEAVTAPTGAPDSFVNTWYYTPAELQKLFPNFTITHLQPVGFWLPPSYLDSFFRRFPRFLRVLNWMEQHISGSWMAWGADHFYVRLVV